MNIENNNDIRNELKEIKEILINLQKSVDALKNSSKKLDEHIDFVESTYNGLKYPLNFIKDSINSLTGRQITNDNLTLEDINF
jgi:hypothetical protein